MILFYLGNRLISWSRCKCGCLLVLVRAWCTETTRTGKNNPSKQLFKLSVFYFSCVLVLRGLLYLFNENTKTCSATGVFKDVFVSTCLLVCFIFLYWLDYGWIHFVALVYCIHLFLPLRLMILMLKTMYSLYSTCMQKRTHAIVQGGNRN